MENFFDGLTGKIITPFSVSYNFLRQGFNTAKQKYPLVIVYCRCYRDISNAILWARDKKLSIRIRNGRHNYEGYSNGNNILAIDLSEMKRIRISKNEKSICVQGGVTNGDIYKYLSLKGYPFPGGTCPSVGLGGYFSGGGWGLSCRYLGLGCDNVEEFRLINYEGDIITCNNEINKDLFWACKGAGGGNFGVIVDIKFKLVKKVQNVTLIEIDYFGVEPEDQREFIDVWQNWLRDSDNRMTLISRIYNLSSDGLCMLVRGIFYGSPEEAKKILQGFLSINKAEYNFKYTSFFDAVSILGASYPKSEKFESASSFVLEDFNYSEILEVVNLIQNPPKGSVYVAISMYALGGKVAETHIDDTAFFYRKAKYIVWIETIWEDNRYINDNICWIKDKFSYLHSITKGSYVNFPYGGLDNYLKDYYGEHVNKLERIKKRYDPFNVFSFPQGLKKRELKLENGELKSTNYSKFKYVRK